jgi:hypothetical protein
MAFILPGIVSLVVFLAFYFLLKSIERKTGKSLKHAKSDGFILFIIVSGGVSTVLPSLLELDLWLWKFTGSLICMSVCLVIATFTFGSKAPNQASKKDAF